MSDAAAQTGALPARMVADRYRVERLLGRGGMGEVHEATDLQSGRRVAIKLILGHRIEQGDALERFEREARVGARLGSPHLIEVLAAGVAPGDATPYIVMELLEGEDLQQRLVRLGPRPAEEVVAHLGEVALALTCLADQRVVHRDLKPSNLFLHEERGRPPRLKVLDLGVAKELTDSASSTGIAGTPVYMAPEQITGAALSSATDRHALGLIAFTLLVGAPYWAKKEGEEAIALAVKMKDGARTPAGARARELGVALPEAFDRWFARATARRPARRFQTAIGAVRALADALAVPVPTWLPAVDSAADDPGDIDACDEPAPPAPASMTLTAPPRPASAAGALAAAAPTAAVGARRPVWRRPGAIVAAVVAFTSLGLAAWRGWPRPAAPPLARRDSVLACPVLKVDGDVADLGWLGAAAASLACERARVILGGLPDRTRLPAELLGLPPVPGDAFPIDPYGTADARTKSLERARRVGDAYLDGVVRRQGLLFDVELELRRADGEVLRRGHDRARALEEAVRLAMQPLIDDRVLPKALIVDPVVADFSQAWDVATMLDYLDLNMAFKNNAGQVHDLWRQIVDRRHSPTDRARFAAWEYAYTFGEDLPTIAFAGVPTTRGEDVTRVRIDHVVHHNDPPGTARRLEELYAQEDRTWARSVLASTLSCLYQDNAVNAAEWGLRAIHEGAKNPTGEWCAPWDQLVSLEAGRQSVARAMQAWEPWHTYAWANDPDPERALRNKQRAYMLSPRDASVAHAYAAALIEDERFEDARAIAVDLATDRNRTSHLEGESIKTGIAASNARFAEALRLATNAMHPAAGDSGWVRPQRLHAGADAVALAALVGNAREVADQVVSELVIGRDPPPSEGVQYGWLPSICAYASPDLARACFKRIDALVRQGATTLPSSPAYISGARRYAEGDRAGAAAAWRPLVGEHQYGALAELMLVAFDTARDREAADDVLAHAGLDAKGAVVSQASLVTARAAEAARRRGDRARAAELAASALDAWGHADTVPPLTFTLQGMLGPVR